MKYFVFPGNDDVFYEMFSSCGEKTIIRKELYKHFNDSIISLLNKLTFHPRLSLLSNIIKNIVVFLLVDDLKKKKEEDRVYVFSNLTIKAIPGRILKKLNGKEENSVVLYLLDNFAQPFGRAAILTALKNHLKYVYTFDKADATKYGFKHFYYIYSSKAVRIENSTLDIVFYGSDKGRMAQLKQIGKRFDENNIRYQFHVIGVTDIACENSHIEINKPIPYMTMIDQIQSASCLLDYVMEGQSGLSFRIAEAVCYNKKLLTNNVSILDFPYYNPRFMQYFERIEDIDLEFIKNDIEVDYGYKGEFSPKNFLERVENDIQTDRCREDEIYGR